MAEENLLIHYWQLPEDIYVSLNDDFHKKFCQILKDKTDYKFKNCFHKILNCPKWHAQRLFTKQIRFTIRELEELRKFSGISEQEVEKEIESIGNHEDGTIIKNPKLPFNLKDIVYVASHLMFDGSYRNKKGCYFYAYEDSLVEYHKKRLSAFGDVPANLIKKENQLYFSYTLGYLASKILDIETFKSTKCYLSEKLKFLAKNNKSITDEIIKAMIIDEGSVDDVVRVELSNKHLVEDLFEVIDPFYKLNKITLRTRSIDFKIKDKWKYNSIVWKLGFSASGFKNLFYSISPLPIKYKQENLEFLNNRQSRGYNQLNKNEIKKLIIKSLINSNKTIEELAKELLVKQTTIRAHLKGHPTYSPALVDLGIIAKTGEKSLRRGGYAKSDIFSVVNLDKAKEFLNK